MNAIPADLMKEYVNSQKFNSTTEIMKAIKEMFREVIQAVMEGELDQELGYEKSQRESKGTVESEPKNYRNGYSQKTVKTQLGEVDINVPRDRNGKYEPQIIGKYNRNADGMEEKILSLYACGMSQRGHCGADKKPLRRRNITGACQQDQRKDYAGSCCLAEQASSDLLSVCFS